MVDIDTLQLFVLVSIFVYYNKEISISFILILFFLYSLFPFYYPCILHNTTGYFILTEEKLQDVR